VLVARYQSVCQLALQAGISRATAWRRIRAIEDTHGGVLVEVAGFRRKRVDAVRLMAIGSDFFGAGVALESETEALERRVARLERKLGIRDV